MKQELTRNCPTVLLSSAYTVVISSDNQRKLFILVLGILILFLFKVQFLEKLQFVACVVDRQILFAIMIN